MFNDFLQRREGGRERHTQRDRERHRSVAPRMHPDKRQTLNLGMCPDGDGTCNLLVRWTTPQPTEPPS